MKQYVSASRAHSASPSQFQALKAKIREATGVPAQRWENVTTVMYKDLFDPQQITVITPVDKGYKRTAFGRYGHRDTLDVRVLDGLASQGIDAEQIERHGVPYIVVSAPLDMFAVSAESSNDYHSYWMVHAFDLRSTVYGVGVDLDPDAKTNLPRLATRLGEKSFYEFSTGYRRFSSYGELRNTLKKKLSSYAQNQIPSEAQLIQAGMDERYIVIHD